MPCCLFARQSVLSISRRELRELREHQAGNEKPETRNRCRRDRSLAVAARNDIASRYGAKKGSGTFFSLGTRSPVFRLLTSTLSPLTCKVSPPLFDCQHETSAHHARLPYLHTAIVCPRAEVGESGGTFTFSLNTRTLNPTERLGGHAG